MRRLFHMPLSPFSRKVRLVLAEKKLEVELLEERPWEKRIDYLRQNPAGSVPMLQIRSCPRPQPNAPRRVACALGLTINSSAKSQ